MSLNPKRSHFAMQEGKRLGHIVSKYGIKVDPKRVEAIDLINIPRNRKEIQYFFVTLMHNIWCTSDKILKSAESLVCL